MKTLLIIFSKKGIQKIVFESLHKSIRRIIEQKHLLVQPNKSMVAREDVSALSSQTHFPAKIQKQFSGYFSGKLKRFSLPLDLQGTEFDQKVWKAIQQIPYGKVWTYKEVARKIGNPNASRAVGNALGRNPVPIIIPCHRVIASDGTLGGYSSGLKIKKTLLSLEQKHLYKK